MRKKLMNRYYCDHCDKGGCSASHMKRHERRCCANPNRVCGMCLVVTGESNMQRPVGELIAALRAGDTPELRKATHGCPACMLAAIIQNNKSADPGQTEEGWPLGCDFEFKTERDKMWKEINWSVGRSQE